MLQRSVSSQVLTQVDPSSLEASLTSGAFVFQDFPYTKFPQVPLVSVAYRVRSNSKLFCGLSAFQGEYLKRSG